MPIIDTHAHLDLPDFAGDLAQVLERAAQAGVACVVCVGTDLASSRRCVALAREHGPALRAAVGIHPSSWAEAGPDDMAAIEALASVPEVVAIGETGLDFHHAGADRAAQEHGLRQHVELARATGKPLIVHARASDDRVLELLAEAGRGVRGVRHCFSASPAAAERYVEIGFHLSFAGALTRPGHKKLKAALRLLPADRLLVETDCPYQTPHGHAGTRNEPAYIVETVAALADLRGESFEATAALTTANAVRLLLGGTSPPQALGPTGD